MRKKWFSIPIYHGKLLVVFCDDFIVGAKQFGIYLSKNADDCLGLALRKTQTGPSEYTIFIKSKSIDDHAVIAHEALHVTNYILEDRCVEASFSNDEPQAYLLSWVVDCIYKTIGQKKTI